MADRWTDERLDLALAAIGTDLDVPVAPAVPAAPGLAAVPCRRRLRRPVVAAVAAAAAVVLAVTAIAPARAAVARWFGLRIESGVDVAPPAGTFADGVSPLAVDVAVTRAGLDGAAVAATSLGSPDAAGVPPEGGVLLAWDDGATTLWVRPADGDLVVVKRLAGEGRVDEVDGLGSFAVAVEGRHELRTPARRVAAGRVLWWSAGGREWRLESDLPLAEIVEVARGLS